MGYIYKVTNTVNGKVYIGQTTRDVPSRWKNHLSDARYPKQQDHSILHKAMRKYGESVFTIDELEQCDNDILDEREQYWIQQYDSVNAGYNISLGGKGYKKCLDDDILRLWEQGKSFVEIADILSVHMETVSRILKRYGIEHRPQQIQPNAVHQYTLDGEYIQSFPSVCAASSYLGIRGSGGIRSVCIGRNRHCHGYRWSYDKVDKLPPIRKDNGLHPVAQYDKDGKLIKVYKKMIDAAKELNVTQGSIWAVCNGIHYYCAGYHFEYCN